MYVTTSAVLAWLGYAVVTLRQLLQAAVLLLHPLQELCSGMLQQVCAAHCAAPTLLWLSAAALHPPGQTCPPQSPKPASSSCTSDHRTFEEVTADLEICLWRTLGIGCISHALTLQQDLGSCAWYIHMHQHVFAHCHDMLAWPVCVNNHWHICMHDSLIQQKQCINRKAAFKFPERYSRMFDLENVF